MIASLKDLKSDSQTTTAADDSRDGSLGSARVPLVDSAEVLENGWQRRRSCVVQNKRFGTIIRCGRTY